MSSTLPLLPVVDKNGSHTEPEAFYAEVFFNAHPLHPVPPSESKEKQRAPNALVPTAFGYAGGQVDFTVDMGTEVRDLFTSTSRRMTDHIPVCDAVDDSKGSI